MNYILFEQSGTFKKIFKKNNLDVLEFDIVKTVHVDRDLDIFIEIDNFFKKKTNIFDNMSDKDFILAFFPCTYFSTLSNLVFKTNKNFDYSIERMRKLYEHFRYFNLLLKICDFKKIPIIIENPYSQPHFLNLYHFLEPSLIIKDRTELGDYFIKPTQFFTENIQLTRALFIPLVFPKNYKLKKVCKTKNGIERSLISSEFAENFFNLYLKEFFINRGEI